jgi:hypothetical protein
MPESSLKNKRENKALYSHTMLKKTTEGGLLQLVGLILRTNEQYKNDKPANAFALAINKSPQHIMMAMNDECFVGTAAWLIFQEMLQVPIYFLWLEAQSNCMIETQKWQEKV